jgi:hypothetical protein
MSTQIQSINSEVLKADSSETVPYQASFIDRFMDFIERLPLPYWLTYLLLFVLEVTLLYIFSWADGWLPAYTFDPIMMLFPVWLWGSLAIMTYLDRLSLSALVAFSPLLEAEELRRTHLRYKFANMPARGVLLSGLFWVIIYAIFILITYEAFFTGYGIGTVLSVVIILVGLFTYFTGSAIYYHSLRKLRLVNDTVKLARQFNLFQLDPVYAFSRVTSQIGIAWMLLLSLTLLIFPIRLAPVPVLSLLVVQILLALAAFVLPLWIVNRRLVAEKRRLVSELNQRLQATIERLHRDIDESRLEQMSQLNDGMASLMAERGVLNSIHTWPWRSGTLTGFLSAVGLPIVLFILQLVIEKWFSG